MKKCYFEERWLLGIKYGFSLMLIWLTYLTTHTLTYCIVGTLEFVVILLFSYALMGLNRVVGQTIHLVLLFLLNVQMIVLYFGGTFTTLVMLTNIQFLGALQGKMSEYLCLIIPALICSFIPGKNVRFRKSVLIYVVLVFSICMEVVVLVKAGTYSPFGNIYQLCQEIRGQHRMQMMAAETNVNADVFYKNQIGNYVTKPDSLPEYPNIVLIFTEGLSQSIIDDKRDIMPNIRNIQDTSLTFTNYYNHTFPTLRGIIGQLYSGYQLNNNDENNLVSLQSILKEVGYETIFINTEPNNEAFSEYLETLGFETVLTDLELVDKDTGYIQDAEAYKLLYNVVEAQSEKSKPFFTAIYTFGTHVSFDSKDVKFGNGSNAVLNKFHNVDEQFSAFMEQFQNSELYDNTVLIFTSDHATYADEDFNKTFPEYERLSQDADKIPLFIYHKNILPEKIDVEGRNSLALAPTVLDYFDISAENYFLAKSLFAPKEDVFNIETIFYDGAYLMNTDNAKFAELSSEQNIEVGQLLAGYFNAKLTGTAVEDSISLQLTSELVETGEQLLITLRNYTEDTVAGEVRFAVWSKENEQDDLKWYYPEQDEAGNYICLVNLLEHEGEGTYIIHAYDGDTFLGSGYGYVVKNLQ